MNSKSKKVLSDQGSQVAQTLKWIGGALFGDADEVLDEIAEHGDEIERTEKLPAGRQPVARAPAPSRQATLPRPKGTQHGERSRPEPVVITVEGYTVEEEDE